MNILDARILLKRSTVSNDTPTIPASSSHTDGSWINTDIYSGEAFVNTTDQRMFVRTGANIQEIPFQNYWVGKSAQGGVIFHTYRDSNNVEHGLVVSIVEQSAASAYSNVTSASIGTARTYDGQYNTNLMKTQTGATSGAWKDADDYTYFAYSDWYLPSIDELNLLSTNRYNVNKTLSTIVGATQIEGVDYWSSTQFDATRSYNYNFTSGYSDYNNKTSTYRVRAIRQF
jgi:hypothetical protein